MGPNVILKDAVLNGPPNVFVNGIGWGKNIPLKDAADTIEWAHYQIR